MLTDNGDTQNLVFSRHGEHLDETMGLTIGDGPIQIIDSKRRHFVSNTLLSGFRFIQTNPCYLWLGKCCPRNDGVVDLESLQ